MNSNTPLDVQQTTDGVTNYPAQLNFVARNLLVAPTLSVLLHDATRPLIVGSSAQGILLDVTMQVDLFETTRVEIEMPGYELFVQAQGSTDAFYDFPGDNSVKTRRFFVRIVAATTGPIRDYMAPVSVRITSDVGYPAPGTVLTGLASVQIMHLDELIEVGGSLLSAPDAVIFGGETKTLSLTLLESQSLTVELTRTRPLVESLAVATTNADGFIFYRFSPEQLTVTDSVIATAADTGGDETWELVVTFSPTQIYTFPLAHVTLQQILVLHLDASDVLRYTGGAVAVEVELRSAISVDSLSFELTTENADYPFEDGANKNRGTITSQGVGSMFTLALELDASQIAAAAFTPQNSVPLYARLYTTANGQTIYDGRVLYLGEISIANAFPPPSPPPPPPTSDNTFTFLSNGFDLATTGNLVMFGGEVRHVSVALKVQPDAAETVVLTVSVANTGVASLVSASDLTPIASQELRFTMGDYDVAQDLYVRAGDVTSLTSFFQVQVVSETASRDTATYPALQVFNDLIQISVQALFQVASSADQPLVVGGSSSEVSVKLLRAPREALVAKLEMPGYVITCSPAYVTFATSDVEQTQKITVTITAVDGGAMSTPSDSPAAIDVRIISADATPPNEYPAPNGALLSALGSIPIVRLADYVTLAGSLFTDFQVANAAPDAPLVIFAGEQSVTLSVAPAQARAEPMTVTLSSAPAAGQSTPLTLTPSVFVFGANADASSQLLGSADTSIDQSGLATLGATLVLGSPPRSVLSMPIVEAKITPLLTWMDADTDRLTPGGGAVEFSFRPEIALATSDDYIDFEISLTNGYTIVPQKMLFRGPYDPSDGTGRLRAVVSIEATGVTEGTASLVATMSRASESVTSMYGNVVGRAIVLGSVGVTNASPPPPSPPPPPPPTADSLVKLQDVRTGAVYDAGETVLVYAGETREIGVSLAFAPSADANEVVTINVRVDTENIVDLLAQPLKFGADNYDQAQTFSLEAQDVASGETLFDVSVESVPPTNFLALMNYPALLSVSVVSLVQINRVNILQPLVIGGSGIFLTLTMGLDIDADVTFELSLPSAYKIANGPIRITFPARSSGQSSAPFRLEVSAATANSILTGSLYPTLTVSSSDANVDGAVLRKLREIPLLAASDVFELTDAWSSGMVRFRCQHACI